MALLKSHACAIGPWVSGLRAALCDLTANARLRVMCGHRNNFNMKRKLQIFISSTFSDLITERQACVEAILRAGHIPAGMELFSAGNESQLDIIKRWIDDSDVYMLLLGGRYGSIEPKSGLSYTEIEYRYAVELGKPLFALIMTDTALDQKVKANGKESLELEQPQKYKEFKKLVLSKISKYFSIESEIKLAILESLIDIQNRNSLTGWVRADEVPDTTKIINQISELAEKNRSLEQDLRIVESERIDKIGDYTYEELKKALDETTITIPSSILENGESGKITLLKIFLAFQKRLAVGITDRMGTSDEDMFLIQNVISHLRIYGLSEIVKVPNVAWSKYQTSKLGNKFLAIYSFRDKK